MRLARRARPAYTIVGMRALLHRCGFVVVTGTALIAAAWLGGPSDPTERAAKRLQPERWYRVSLHGTDIGHFRTRGRMSRAGYRFDSELVFRLGTAPLTRIAETHVFESRAPYPLVSATHAYTSGGDSTNVGIERHSEGLAGAANGRTTELDWDYLMRDYLAVETWLDRDPDVGASLESRSIDFDRLALKRESWSVTDRQDTRHRLRNSGASTVETDENHLPVRLSLANLFDMTLEGTAWTAQSWRRTRPASDARTYDVMIDTPLDSSRDLTRLLVRVRTDEAIDPTIWPLLRRNTVGDLLLESRRSDHRSLAPGELKALSAATTAHPAADPAVRELAARAASEVTDPARQIEALVHFVHGYIDYADEDAARPVLNVLRERRGDCTEYANLLTTMARALGFAARTVTGLAYDAGTEMFALHNWSEVALDGRWLPVDPTWNQVPADAGHLRLPDKPGLAVFGLLSNIEFELVQAEYGPRKS